MLVCNLNDNRCKKKGWMLDDEWEWWIIYTDHMANTCPLWNYLAPIFSFLQTNFGNNINEQCPNGPNKDLCMENLGGKLNTNFIDHWSSLSGLERRDNDKKFRANDKLTRVQVNY